MLPRRTDSHPALARLFGDLFDRELFNWNSSNYSETNTTLPAVNIKETPNHFTVEVAVPGMDKTDFTINLKDNVLTISSEKNSEEEKTEGSYSRREYSYQSFCRSFSLPQNIVDSDNISAKYENGELLITIPKRDEAKPKEPRIIDIL